MKKQEKILRVTDRELLEMLKNQKKILSEKKSELSSILYTQLEKLCAQIEEITERQGELDIQLVEKLVVREKKLREKLNKMDESLYIRVEDKYKPLYEIRGVLEMQIDEKLYKLQDKLTKERQRETKKRDALEEKLNELNKLNKLTKEQKKQKTKITKQLAEINKKIEKLNDLTNNLGIPDISYIQNKQTIEIEEPNILENIQPIEKPFIIDENMIQTAQIEIKSDSMVSTQQAKYTPLTQNGQTIVSLDTPTVQQIQLKQNELEDELIELNELMNEKEKIIVNASFKPYHIHLL